MDCDGIVPVDSEIQQTPVLGDKPFDLIVFCRI